MLNLLVRHVNGRLQNVNIITSTTTTTTTTTTTEENK
jgi:hypothetical protein